MKETDATRGYIRGARAAADQADKYNGSTVHPYRLGDCILGKLNVPGSRSRPRRNEQKLQPPDDAWTVGFSTALAEIHRLLAGGNCSSGICEVARNAGVTLASAKTAGCSPFDLRELKRAGVARSRPTV